MNKLMECWFRGDLIGYITQRYYSIISEKQQPQHYDEFSYIPIETEKTFTEMNSTLDETHPASLFHMSIVRLYLRKKYNPDIPWWEYEDEELKEIYDTFRNSI